MFSYGQQLATEAAFRLAGYDGPLRTLPIDSTDERGFVPGQNSLSPATRDDLTQVLTQLLGVKVWLMDDADTHRVGINETVPVE
jgi:hypothetical protein